ncbi:MAG: GNAT family N-acetyltransferase [Acidimicrobiales bacterium]
MQTSRCADASSFLHATAAYRSRYALQTNVIGSVATSIADGLQRYDASWWWLVLEQDHVVGAACRTAPFCLQLGPMGRDAAAALSRRLAVEDDGFPCVNGDPTTVDSFLETYASTGSPGSRRAPHLELENIIYEARDLHIPDVPGVLRPATMTQFDLASRWMTDFSTFINGHPYQPTHHDVEALRARIDASMLYFWWRGDEPVAMAGHASPVTIGTETVTRVAPVFTPEEHRRHGFAAAVTAVLTKRLVERHARVMLLADANYPTSNGVYRRIGYVAVDRLVRVELA